MTVKIAEKTRYKLSEKNANKIATSVVAGASAFIAGPKITSVVLGWLSAGFTLGASLAAPTVANSALNAAITRSYGRSVARFFLAGDQQSDVETIVKILIALVGLDYSFNTPYDDLIKPKS